MGIELIFIGLPLTMWVLLRIMKPVRLNVSGPKRPTRTVAEHLRERDKTDRYLDAAVAWRNTTPESVMSTEEILVETLRILRMERASALQSDMEVAPDKVYGVDNSTFQSREGWE